MKSILEFLRPNLARIILLVLLVVMTSLIAVDYQATSKVSWHEKRGVPLAFVAISVYKGPCDEGGLCREADIEKISLNALIVDVVVWYLASCVVVSGLSIIQTWSKARELV